MRTTSEKPPIGSAIGDGWYNLSTGLFYRKNTETQWIATDLENHVIDVITTNDIDEAYERAMSIL